MGIEQRKNVIVVGAGASKEFGLPTGAELAQKIKNISDIRYDGIDRLQSGDWKLVETLKILSEQKGGERNINPYLHAAWKIRDNMDLAPSIDNFLDTHRNDLNVVEFGKIAIAHAILAAERQSTLYVDPRKGDAKLNTVDIRETWLTKFFSILVAQRNYQDFLTALANITFVSFNYDRCIVHFFACASKAYFSLDNQQVQTVIETLSVVHPYGSVGAYQTTDGRSNFGAETSGNGLLSIVGNLRTFTEGAADGSSEEIRSSIEEAEILIFLGFGYLPLNMDLLLGGEKYPVRHVIGTGKGLSKNSTSQLVSELENSFEFEGELIFSDNETAKVNILDCTCGDLFWEFERFLSNEINPH